MRGRDLKDAKAMLIGDLKKVCISEGCNWMQAYVVGQFDGGASIVCRYLMEIH